MNTPTYETLIEMDEFFLAGLFENRFDSYIKRFSNAIRLYAEQASAVEYDGTALYPAGAANLWRAIPDSSAGFSYSYSFYYDKPNFSRKTESLENDSKKTLMYGVDGEMSILGGINITPQYRCGGAGYTHSIINYERILKEGLKEYRKRLERLAANEENAEKREFRESLLMTLEAITILLAKHVAKLESVENPDAETRKLIAALKRVPENPAESFHEAIVATNFMWYVDDADSIGRLDQFLYPYYKKDIDSGEITREAAGALLREFWRSFDARNGWHMILGGTRSDGAAAYNDLTLLCLETIKNNRRPNTGLRVREDMPDEVWDATLDSIASGCGHPSLYNEGMYADGIRDILGVKGGDAADFAYGGCTEIMFQGMSNVGSIDAGINLLEVLENELPRLPLSESYEKFKSNFLAKCVETANTAVSQSNLNQRMMALYRPQPIRSLFIEDCIDRGIDYNAGGARYNGSVINVVGFANAVNSLFTIKKIFAGELPISLKTLASAVSANFAGYEKELAMITRLDKHGCDNEEVTRIAAELADAVFNAILARRCWRGDGFCVPGTIMFVTYAAEGADIGATPDGRSAFSPIADSYGPMQGTDIKGPTAAMMSATKASQRKGLGTLVFNLRMDGGMFDNESGRHKVRNLLQSYFSEGGIMTQVNVVDSEVLKDAIEHPENHKSLIVRIGGYSEYFNRLSPELKKEVLARTCHSG
jgi:formate C-acetyltransferase